MNRELWEAVDRYIIDRMALADPALDAALESSRAAELPAINVTAPQGKMLSLFAQMLSARRILEIGTLGGYSTIWLARGLSPGGRLITLEADKKHAEIARQNIERAGLADVVEIRLGRAQQTLPQLAAEGCGPFDLVFIDADKPSSAEYFAWAVDHTRRGGLIIVDNVVRKGAVADPGSEDENVQGVRRLYDLVASEPRVSATAIQTVGSKGYDGFSLAIVIADRQGGTR